jgi:SWI/SNF-related matrix-associated actin-dependent regulator 1 of chromatin subfamily A
VLDLPYQREGASFLASMGRAGLFDAPGLGKTCQAIKAMDRAGLERGVVVAPASVCDVWMQEFRKFSSGPRRLLRGRTSDDLNLWMRFRSDILITSYEMATKWRRELEKDFREFTIWDESHYLKSLNAQRTRAAFGHQCDGKFGYGKWGGYAWLLTGTPMANQPLDIWTWLRFVGGTDLTYRAFVARYFIEIPGAFASAYKPRKDTIPELRSLIQKYSLRRTLEDVDIQLPPLWITTQELDGDTSAVREMLAEHEGLNDAVLEAVNKGGLSFLDAGHISTLRRLVGEAKAPVFAAQLVEELNGGLDKVVVFCWHKQPIQTLRAVLERAGIDHVVFDGSTSDAGKAAAKQRFQEDPDCRVFIGSSASYEGITLTSANQVVLLEQSWVPKDNAQALKRVHRIGQTRNVHVRLIALSKSIDAEIAAAVARKTQHIIEVQGSEI